MDTGSFKSSGEGGFIPPLRSVPKKPNDPKDMYLYPAGGGVSGNKPSWQKIPIEDILKRLTDLENNPSSGLPDGAIAKEFDVCENGSPTSYWFVVWNAEPNLDIQQ